MHALPFSAVAADPVGDLGFGYCPPSVIPTCIDRFAQTRARKDLDQCGRDVLRFARMLGSYRVCLDHESERAVGTGNEAIALFRCLAQHRGGCHPARRNGMLTPAR